MNFIEKEFSTDEIQMLHDIFFHAVSGLGLGKYTWDENGKKKELKSNPYILIKDKFFSYQVDNKIHAPTFIWIEFLNAFNEACQTIDPSEMQTITGYEWKQTQKLVRKTKKIIEEHFN